MPPAPARSLQSVTGLVPLDDLGRVLMHEHVATRSLGVRENWPRTYDRAAVVGRCVETLSRLREAGISTVVDHTTFDLGRDPELLRDVARDSGITILAVTGFWTSPPAAFGVMDKQSIAELFAQDVEEGMAGTGVRAALVKATLDVPAPTPLIEKCVRAAGVAHRLTGAPITAHTDARARTGDLLLDLLQDEGVAPERVLVGHSGDTDDLGYLVGLLERGAWLGLDRFGAEDVFPDARRADTLIELIEAGWAGRLLLSHDASCWSGWRDNAAPDGRRPQWDPFHLPTRVLPGLASRGVDSARVSELLGSNPREFLTPAE